MFLSSDRYISGEGDVLQRLLLIGCVDTIMHFTCNQNADAQYYRRYMYVRTQSIFHDYR